MSTLILNDTHCAAHRAAGTTPASLEALHKRTLDNFSSVLMKHLDRDVIHAGDLLDTFDVANVDVARVYAVLATWLEASGRKLWALRANHDWRPRADKMSSWELLFQILQATYPEQVFPVLDEVTHIKDNIWGLGHVANSDLFELQLERALELENSVLIAHANYCNQFAEGNEQTLNITDGWAREFVSRGNRLYCGHEHQKSTHLAGRVVMLGSQDSTSIADCLGNDAKFAHLLEEDGTLTPIQTMDVTREFVVVDWQDLASVGDQPFIRISGTATRDQAGDVVDIVAKYRRASPALVIANAVQIEGMGGIDEVGGVTLEELRAFDVREALLGMFEPDERKILEGVLDD